MGDNGGAGRVGDPDYLMKRGDSETERLIFQAAYRRPLTERLFADAGISKGMSVLDLGSGAGDVAFLAADMVGPSGRVVGVDADGTVLRTARARAEAAGVSNVEFVEGDCRTADAGTGFDAVVGRFILMYLGDPAGALKAAAERLRPGGIVAFMEVNWLEDSLITYPNAPLWEQVWDWMRTAVDRAGIDIEMGFRLHQVFADAGLPAPEQLLQARIVGAEKPDAAVYAAETARGMLPVMEKHGVVTAAELDTDTLADRLLTELAAVNGVAKVTDAVGAHTRIPG